MHFKSFFRSIIFFSILCYTSSFLAQNISGTLVDFKGNHLNNVRVILKDNNDKIVKFIFTSEQGFFEFNNLSFGDYQLLIQHMNLEKKVLFISLPMARICTLNPHVYYKNNRKDLITNTLRFRYFHLNWCCTKYQL